MTRSAPRLSPRLVEQIDRLDDGRMPLAELWRRVGAAADDLGLPRPSYERVRGLAQAARRRAAREHRLADILVDVAFRSRPPEAVRAGWEW